MQVFDPVLTDFDIEVFNWMARAINETGEPMKQAEIANKLRCARATVRSSLIELDKRGHLNFSRFKPQNATLVDDRTLTNQPIGTPPKPKPTLEEQISKRPWAHLL